MKYLMNMKRPLPPWDPFFDQGNIERELWCKRSSVQAVEVGNILYPTLLRLTMNRD